MQRACLGYYAMKKILVLGGSSFTGGYICRHFRDEYEVITSSRNGKGADCKFDAVVDDITTLDSTISDLDVIINCISNGDLDSCEKDPELCKRINYDLVEALCHLQKKYHFHLIHFSSNAVYDGENAPYSESSHVNAINEYGRIKDKADQYIRKNLSEYTILRPITMYGTKLKEHRHNPFSFFYQQLSENKTITAVNDVYVNMLYVEDLVECVKSAINNQIYGIFNISGDDVVNRCEFVSIIKSLMPESTSMIRCVGSDQFKTEANRPKDTSFNNTAMKKVLNVYPESINVVLQRLVNNPHLQNVPNKHAA